MLFLRFCSERDSRRGARGMFLPGWKFAVLILATDSLLLGSSGRGAVGKAYMADLGRYTGGSKIEKEETRKLVELSPEQRYDQENGYS